jgi:small-conductance mechanosensitive channel
MEVLVVNLMEIGEWMKAVLGGFYNPVVIILKITGIVLLALLIIKLGTYVIKKVFEKKKGQGLDGKKFDTMLSLLLSVLRYAVYIIAAVIILTDVFRMTSVLAAAGIGGIAIGFGAQSLIKDMISGFFIVMEDQYAVGDLITIDSLTGTVERLELRVTRIRNFNGDLYIIPNGEIKRVVNHTRGNKAVIVDIPVAYSSDADKAVKAAERVCSSVAGEFNTIVEQPRVLGITELGRESMNMRIIARTVPNAQWEVERRIRMLIKEKFEKEKIAFYDRNKIVASNAGNDSASGGGVGG